MENKTTEELVEEYVAKPSDALFDEIFERTYKMALAKYKKLIVQGVISEADLMQLIRVATLRAIYTYNKIKGKFSTWLHIFYKDEIFDYYMEKNIIRKPEYLMWKSNRERIMALHPEYYVDTISLDRKVKEDNDETLINSVVDNEPTPDMIAESKGQIEWLLKYIHRLPPREMEMIIDYFGLLDNRPKTLQELGNKHGVTRERIRQVIKKGLIKLKRYLSRDDINFD